VSVCRNVVAVEGVCAPREAVLQQGDAGRRESPVLEPDGECLQASAHPQEILEFIRRYVGDAYAPVWRQLHQVLGGQELQSLTDGRDADPELDCQAAGHQACTGLVPGFSSKDSLANNGCHAIGQSRGQADMVAHVPSIDGPPAAAY
jgi:hypothetical protein